MERRNRFVKKLIPSTRSQLRVLLQSYQVVITIHIMKQTVTCVCVNVYFRQIWREYLMGNISDVIDSTHLDAHLAHPNYHSYATEGCFHLCIFFNFRKWHNNCWLCWLRILMPAYVFSALDWTLMNTTVQRNQSYVVHLHTIKWKAEGRNTRLRDNF